MKSLNLAGQAQCRPIVVQQSQPLRLLHAGGRTLRLRCTTGMLLITCFDHPADIDLAPMQPFTIPNDGLVLIDIIGRQEGVVEILPRVSATAGQHCSAFYKRIILQLAPLRARLKRVIGRGGHPAAGGGCILPAHRVTGLHTQE